MKRFSAEFRESFKLDEIDLRVIRRHLDERKGQLIAVVSWQDVNGRWNNVIIPSEELLERLGKYVKNLPFYPVFVNSEGVARTASMEEESDVAVEALAGYKTSLDAKTAALDILNKLKRFERGPVQVKYEVIFDEVIFAPNGHDTEGEG